MKISLVALLAMVAMVAARGQDPTDESAKLIGTWQAVSAVNDGKAVPEETVKKLQLTLTKDSYKTALGSQVLFDSTYRVDASHQPTHIDLVGTEGESKGRIAQGIYSLREEQLTICYTMPGGERPAAFESHTGSGITLVVWRRAAK